MTEDIVGESREPVEECAAPHRVRWLTPDVSVFEGIETYEWLPRPTLYRLALAELLPMIGRVLYLDADLVIVRDLGELLDVDLDGQGLAAVRDSHFTVFGLRHGPPWGVWRDDRDRPLAEAGRPYFNAGVMAIDLEQWRREGSGARMLAMAKIHRFPYLDQDALNLEFAGRWRELHPQWNVQSGHLDGPIGPMRSCDQMAELAEAVADPAILHYSERTAKPWIIGGGHRWGDRWFDELDATPFAGWRPDTAPTANPPIRARVAGARLSASSWVRSVAAPSLARNLKSDDSVSWRTHRLTATMGVASGGRVAAGLFRGLLVGTSLEHLLPAQVLGTFRSELHDSLECLLDGEPGAMVVLGATDVILPAGCASRLSDGVVHVVERDAGMLRACSTIAELNGVAHRVVGHTSLSPDVVAAVPDGSPWIVAGSWFDLHVLEAMRVRVTRSAMIVAGRAGAASTMTPAVVGTFRDSHRVTMIQRAGRDPFALTTLHAVDDIDRWLAVDDHDDQLDHWLLLEPVDRATGEG